MSKRRQPAMVKVEMVGGDDTDIITAEEPKQKKKTNGVKDVPAALKLVPESSHRRRASKKAVARKASIPRPRVKNPSTISGGLTPEEALAQAWEYTYNHRGGFQQ